MTMDYHAFSITGPPDSLNNLSDEIKPNSLKTYFGCEVCWSVPGSVVVLTALCFGNLEIVCFVATCFDVLFLER